MIPDDADCRKALAQLEGWIWEDEEAGTRVTGARSASWDTGFALQALATVPEVEGVEGALQCGADFLRRQQIDTSFEGFPRSLPDGPQGWLVLCRRVARLAGHGLHGRSGAGHNRSRPRGRQPGGAR